MRMTRDKAIVVFVDDHVDTCECFALALEHQGFHVLTAHDAEEGIALVKARRPRAVVANLGMHRGGGWRVCDFVRSYGAANRSALVLLTGGDGADGGGRVLAESPDVRLLTTPCGPAELAGALRDMLVPSPPRRAVHPVSDRCGPAARDPLNSPAGTAAERCPSCEAEMCPAEVDPRPPSLRFRAGAPRAPFRKERIWRCHACGHEHARQMPN
jgi:DNA-binding response OmpR family regulator